MAKSLSVLSQRRARLQISLIIAGIVALIYFSTYNPLLLANNYDTGWILFGLFILLATYNARKKLPYPSLFKSSTWLQFHLYVGTFSALLFLIHTGFAFPTGGFDNLLYWNVFALILTGFIGLLLSRTLPKRLTDIGQEVIYERIPQFRLQCLEEADQLVLSITEQYSNRAIQDYYLATLRPYLSQGPRCIELFFSSNRKSQVIVQDITNLFRYLREEEIEVAKQLQDIVERRADLDKHYCYQHVLKIWLFIHIPLTFSVLVLLALHVVLVYAF